jgi:hypothetical protein
MRWLGMWLMQRGEVWWVEFDPAVGSEIRKTLPAIRSSLNYYNLQKSLVWGFELLTDPFSHFQRNGASPAFQIRYHILAGFRRYGQRRAVGLFQIRQFRR